MIASRHEIAFEILRTMNTSDVMSVPDLTHKTRKSNSTVELIIAPLRRAGLVTSQRGPGGGYRLARPLSEISVQDLLSALSTPANKSRAPGLLAALMPQIRATPLSDLAERLATPSAI